MSDPTNAELIARLNMNASQRNIHDETGLLIFDAAAALEQAGKEIAEARVENQWQRMYSDHLVGDREFLHQVADSYGIRTDEVTTAFLARAAQARTTPTTDAVKLDPEACGYCWACLDAEGIVPMGYVTCSNCGNKRCPHAADHALECTRSNEPGQPGATRYPAAKLPEKGEN